MRFWSRNRKDWTDKFPSVASAIRSTNASSAILDGEIVVLDSEGHSSFEKLKDLLGRRQDKGMVFQIFDLLYLDGYDLTGATLIERKHILKELIGEDGNQAIRYNDHVTGMGQAFFRQACDHGIEGIISKRADGVYQSGRSTDWLKIKCIQRQEFTIVGFTPSSTGEPVIGSLILAVYDGDALTYTGRVGTGFSDELRRQLRDRLLGLNCETSPLATIPNERELRKAVWARPELVCEVAFGEWTKDGRLRHPSFQGLREDKTAREVVREKPKPLPPKAKSRSKSKNPKTSKAVIETIQVKGIGKELAVASSKDEPIYVHGIKITNRNKVLYKEEGFTKADLIAYYEKEADWILPHLSNRPLTFFRCPEGYTRGCFFQKHAMGSEPKAIRTIGVLESEGTEPSMAVDSLPGLIATVQLGVLELHIWGSRSDKVDYPDRMVFDLDPDEAIPYERVLAAARELRERLEALDLISFPMTTGGKGMHVVVPLERRHDFDEVKAFSRVIARRMQSESNDFITEASKSKRKGKIFVDYLRNGRGATAICPFSTRARKGATVAAPISWEELKKGLAGNKYDIKNIETRLSRLKKDPWGGYFDVRQRLTAAKLKKAQES